MRVRSGFSARQDDTDAHDLATDRVAITRVEDPPSSAIHISPHAQMNTRQSLVDLTVRDFVAAVASADEPVPAGGSVAACTGASSAALLALVSEVLERHTPGVLLQERDRARGLQQQLLELVDVDARAFRAFLDAERGSPARSEAGVGSVEAPMRIGRACLEVVGLAGAIEPHVRGAMHLDVGAARRMAEAGASSSLAIAEYNLRMVSDLTKRQALEAEIRAARGQR